MANELALPLSDGLIVLFGEHAGAEKLLELTARLALRGRVYMLDCGNRSNMYRVARSLRPLTRDPAFALKNIRLSRAFTCYQVFALLGKMQSTTGVPVLIMDFLSTFLDESVRVDECFFLFEKTLERVSYIAQFAPVIVSAKPLLTISRDRAGLLERLKSYVAHYWEELPEIALDEKELQPALFEDF